MKTITIAIGGDTAEPVIYHPVETNAPKDYDGFGTFEVATYNTGDGERRIVLIRSEHYQWQTMRYSSGMNRWQEAEYDEAAITEVLWKRLLQRE